MADDLITLLDEAYTKAIRQRNDNIIELREEGWTLARIGEKYGITRERVRQIINQYESEKEERNL